VVCIIMTSIEINLQDKNDLNSLLNESRSVQVEDDQDVFASNLIEEVRKYPCLWDVKARSFKETPKKKIAWIKVSEALNSDGKYSIFKITTSFDRI